MKANFPLLNSLTTRSSIPQIVKTSIIPLSPSQPIHVHHNKILSIKTQSLSKISSRAQYNNPISSLLFGGFLNKYRKFESIIPSEILLVGVNNKVSLDGTIDWAIFPKDALTSYSGMALNVKLNRIPWSSGLSSILKQGYLHISGRGDVYLKSFGEIYTVQLQQGEEIIVRQKGVVGISVNGEELGNCCEPVTLGNHDVETKEFEVEKSDNELKDMLLGALDTFGKAWRYIIGKFGKDEFVRVKGPRSLILTSDVSTKFEFNYNNGDQIEKVEKQLQRSSQDFLSYVTVKDGKVTFESTPNFKETVDKIERK